MGSIRAFSGLPAAVTDYATLRRDSKDLSLVLKSLDDLYYGEGASPAVQGAAAEYGIKLRRKSQKYSGQGAMSGLSYLLILLGASGIYNGKPLPPEGHWKIEPKFLAKDKFVVLWFYSGKTEEESFGLLTTHASAADVERYATDMVAQYPTIRGAVLHQPGASPYDLDSNFYYLDGSGFSEGAKGALAIGAVGLVAIGAIVYFVKRKKK